jgi:hypothetical protein
MTMDDDCEGGGAEGTYMLLVFRASSSLNVKFRRQIMEWN